MVRLEYVEHFSPETVRKTLKNMNADIKSRWRPGQSHLIFGTGSTGSVTTSLLSKPCCANALYKPLENLDAIALRWRRQLLDSVVWYRVYTSSGGATHMDT